MKKTVAIVLCLMLLCGIAQAKGNVSYVGGAEEFVFLPGSSYSDSDLFETFKNVMPGDVLEQKIRVQNDQGKRVRIYMRAEGANQADRVFLNQLHLTVKSGNKEIFDAQADEKAQLTKETLLGTFKKSGGTDLTVTLTVPLDLGNEYMNKVGTVPWTFLVEEIGGGSGDDDDDDTPETGDWFEKGVWMGVGAALVLAIVWLLVLMKRRRKEEQ